MYNLMSKLYDLFVFLCELAIWVEFTNYAAWKCRYAPSKSDKFSPNSIFAQVVAKTQRTPAIPSTTVAEWAKKCELCCFSDVKAKSLQDISRISSLAHDTVFSIVRAAALQV